MLYTQPTWVFSSRARTGLAGSDIRFVRGDVRPAHAEMRAAAGGKNIWIVGGGDLAGQFHDAGLLDEMIIQIGSVTLGKGKQLFPRRALSPSLRLMSVHQMGEGMVELRYAVGPGPGRSPATPAAVPEQPKVVGLDSPIRTAVPDASKTSGLWSASAGPKPLKVQPPSDRAAGMHFPDAPPFPTEEDGHLP